MKKLSKRDLEDIVMLVKTNNAPRATCTSCGEEKYLSEMKTYSKKSYTGGCWSCSKDTPFQDNDLALYQNNKRHGLV